MANGEIETTSQQQVDSNGGQTPVGIIPKTSTGKRGRPPGSKNGVKTIDTGGSEKPVAASVPPVDALESAKFIGVGVVALLELGESFIHSNCANKIEKRLPSKLAEFKEMAGKMQMQEKEKELIAQCSEKIAVRHELLTKYAPEAVLIVTLAQYGLRQASLMRFVDNVTKQKPVDKPVTQAEVQPSGQ